MAENEQTSAAPVAAEVTPPTPPRRSPGHRGADVKDTVAEMAAKAHEISLEAGSRMAAAMKDVVNAAAGLSDFVVESARDLVQFMVRRGQMTQDEADKLLNQVEASQPKRKATPPAPPAKPKPVSTVSDAPKSASAAPKSAPSRATPVKSATKATKPAAKSKSPSPKKPAAKKATAKKAPAKKSPAKKSPAKKASKPAAKRAPARKPAAKSPTKKTAKRPAAKKSTKASRK